MKSQQTQIKLRPSNKERESVFLTCKIKKLSPCFLPKGHVSFSKNVTIKIKYLKKEKTRRRKKSFFLLNSLIFVFIVLIKQIFLSIFWVNGKKTLIKKQNFQRSHDSFYRNLLSNHSFKNKLGHQIN